MTLADVITHLVLLLLLAAALAAFVSALGFEARAAYRDDWSSDTAADASARLLPLDPASRRG